MAKIVQKELGLLFLTETARLFDHAIISVTVVDLDSDFSVARVYLSFSLNDNQQELLKKVNGQKNTIRRWLGKRVASKMHSIPDLKFYIDDMVIQGARVTALIDQLDAIES